MKPKSLNELIRDYVLPSVQKQLNADSALLSGTSAPPIKGRAVVAPMQIVATEVAALVRWLKDGETPIYKVWAGDGDLSQFWETDVNMSQFVHDLPNCYKLQRCEDGVVIPMIEAKQVGTGMGPMMKMEAGPWPPEPWRRQIDLHNEAIIAAQREEERLVNLPVSRTPKRRPSGLAE